MGNPVNILDTGRLLYAAILLTRLQIILNPPYQEDVKNEGDRANPVYDKFLEAAFSISKVVVMIHPARFLFNAGQTSKQWNKKMLMDEHFKVLYYEQNASNIFPNTDIKGGVAISMYDASRIIGPVGTFTAYPELNSIIRKTESYKEKTVDEIISSRGLYRFSDKYYEDNPGARERMSAGTGNMIVSNIYDRDTSVFYVDKPEQGEYIRIMGRQNNSRIYKYILKEYVISNDFLWKYNVMMPEANGNGRFGEVLSSPYISSPGEGATDTFISIGLFDTEQEANAMLKYIKTKFFRALLGVNKVTQHNPKSVWRSIPQQDFTSASDIDWSDTTPLIDQQLYRKYNLTQEEIDFIESHVKEMN